MAYGVLLYSRAWQRLTAAALAKLARLLFTALRPRLVTGLAANIFNACGIFLQCGAMDTSSRRLTIATLLYKPRRKSGLLTKRLRIHHVRVTLKRPPQHLENSSTAIYEEWRI